MTWLAHGVAALKAAQSKVQEKMRDHCVLEKTTCSFTARSAVLIIILTIGFYLASVKKLR